MLGFFVDIVAPLHPDRVIPDMPSRLLQFFVYVIRVFMTNNFGKKKNFHFFGGKIFKFRKMIIGAKCN